MDTTIQNVLHYGTIKIDSLSIDCVVLDDAHHTRAYIQKQLLTMFGVLRSDRTPQGVAFLRVFAPKYLNSLEKTDVPKIAKMPHGGRAKIYPAGILAELPFNVIDAALNGKLHHKQRHFLPHCLAIAKALAGTGEIALIDEATGFQHAREPHALQDLFSRIIREECADWERRFPPEYYEALFALFGWRFNSEREKPPVIGKITAQWVYESVFPFAIVKALRDRRDDDRGKTKLHQWLKNGGLSLLEKQIHAVTMIALSSLNYDDFNARCSAAFSRRNQHKMFLA